MFRRTSGKAHTLWKKPTMSSFLRLDSSSSAILRSKYRTRSCSFILANLLDLAFFLEGILLQVQFPAWRVSLPGFTRRQRCMLSNAYSTSRQSIYRSNLDTLPAASHSCRKHMVGRKGVGCENQTPPFFLGGGGSPTTKNKNFRGGLLPTRNLEIYTTLRQAMENTGKNWQFFKG